MALLSSANLSQKRCTSPWKVVITSASSLQIIEKTTKTNSELEQSHLLLELYVSRLGLKASPWLEFAALAAHGGSGKLAYSSGG
jgi:hypothetical protein